MNARTFLIKLALVRKDDDDRAIHPEKYVGLGLGALPFISMATQGKDPNLRNFPNVGQEQFAHMTRPGDVVLTRSKEPYSGFRVLTSALSGSPYYHAELAYNEPSVRTRSETIPGGKRTAMVGAEEGSEVPNLLRENESALLMRMKQPLPRSSTKELFNEVQPLMHDTYSESKPALMGMLRSVLPSSPSLEKLPKIEGEVCSTGPASVLRGCGINPKLNTVPGLELASDYMRSKAWQPVATYGKLPNPNFKYYAQLPTRALMGGALGYGGYQAVKDVREGQGLAPVAGALGAMAGGAAAGHFELAGSKMLSNREYLNEVRVKYTDVLRKMGLEHGAARKVVNRACGLMMAQAVKAPLWPALGGSIAGGLGSYLLTKWLYNRKKPQPDNA